MSGRARTWLHVIVAALICASGAASAATNISAWVYPGPSGRLIRQPDALGNRVLDYTSVGYKSGAVPLPEVPVKVTISPVAGDDGASIQAAINQVAALPLDTNGFRGAVLLTAGEYQISNSITINASGVVLRGTGSGTNGTVLRASGPGQRSLVRITGSGSAGTVSGTTHNITNNYVPVGATSFYVDSTGGLTVGDRVFVRRNANQQWIDDLGMNLLTNPWTPSGYLIDSDRIITRIEGNRIFINAPLTCAIEQRYTGGTIRKYTWSGRIQNVGIENLRGVSDFVAADDEDHGWVLIQINSTENVWVRNVTSQYFGYACVALYNGTRCATVRDCQSLDPVSIITGGRRYAFVLDDCQLCLVQNCYTDEDRHQFVTQSLTTGPNVFVDGLSDVAKSDCGPHHRWGTGAIWDCVTVNGQNLNVQNRGNLGTGHGWSGANEVVWNGDADGGYVVQNPPTARNWLIGSVGPIENGTVYVGPHDPGTYDSHGTNVFPNSLYYAELQDRLAAPNLQTREYWLGDIDAFTNNNPAGESVPVDAAWLAAVQAAAGSEPIHGFDVVTNGHWVPFTFNFSLSANEHIVAATLQLSLRSAGGSSDDALCLDSITNSLTFADLGWLPMSTTTNPTVRVLDLASRLGLLADGKLNVAVQNDAGVDWAMLEVQVATNLNAGWFGLLPVADATVRGGASANNNFGTATTLTVKEDSSADNDRKAYLRWDLSGVTGTVYQAKVRFTPVNVGTNGIEQGATVSTNNSWSENGITWNNQPGGGKRFVTWIPGTNSVVEYVVTPQVLAALAGDRQLSLQLYSLRNVGGAGIVDYASREATDAATRPQLLLLVSDTPPVISDITNRSIAVNGDTGSIPFTVSDDKTPADNLVVSGFSSNTNLVPNANLVFGGGGSNRTITVTSAPNQSGLAVITVTATDGAGLSGSDNFTLTVSSHPPAMFVWNGPGLGANNWSAGGNWLPPGPPEALDSVKFFDAGAAGVSVSNVNNFVDATFGGTVTSVQYGNTNGNHTTLIGAGDALSISGSGGLTVGTETDNGSAQTVFATITGPGGALDLDAPDSDLIVRQGAATGGVQRATLDLSGLGNFTASIDQVLVGFAAPVIRATGTLFLARTNAIMVTGSPGICAGDNGSNGGGPNFIYLGQTNAIFADSITIARQKATATLRFNPALANSCALFRGSDGLSRVAVWTIGDHSLQSTSSSSSVGTNDFSGGTLDACVETMILGRTQKTTGNNSTGVLTFTSGFLDVDTLQIGFQTQSGATSGGFGQVNVNGATAMLFVNGVLELGHTSGGAGTTNTSGALFVNGGSVFANSIVAGAGSGTNQIALNDAALFVTNTVGTPAAPIARVSLTNSVLQFSVAANVTNMEVTTLTTGGATNTIGIGSLEIPALYPAQFTLIKYSTMAGAGFNFVLGPLPDVAVCGGYLSNNLANGSIDLVITNCAVPDAFLTWDGTRDGDWDTTTTNWKNNVASDLTYDDGDNVVFSDSATGTTSIALTATLIPASVTVSNNAKTYTFGDLGKLSGAGGLIKQGSGALILANEGNNDFTGGIAINGGTLRVGDGGTNGVLPAGNVINNASLVFNRSDEVACASVISGTGAMRKDGAGVLTLYGANSFSGTLTVAAGTLKTANAAALGTTAGVTIITNDATLDVNGLNLGLEPVTVSGSGVDGSGAIVNNTGNPSFLNLNLAYVTLAGDATFGGTGRWDLRSGNTSLTNAALSTGGHAYRLTKTGTNQVSLVAVFVDPALGDIDVQSGVLSLEKVISSLGDPTRTLFLHTNATLQFYQVSNVFNKIVVMQPGALFLNNNGSNTFGGPITLQGSNTFTVNGTWLKLTNALSGPGSLVKLGGSPLFLSGSNTYTGGTIVNGGTLALVGDGSIGNSPFLNIAAGATLDVSGRTDGGLTLVAGQTLLGNGTVLGSVQVSPGSTLAPGTSIGVLTVTNVVTLQGTTFMELSASTHTNDSIRGAARIDFGGTLSLTNLSGTFTVGDTFKLFSATQYTGTFGVVAPAIPAVGLGWDTNTLAVDGTLRITNTPTPSPKFTGVLLSGSSLMISGTNGVPAWPYYVLTSTNVAQPLASWRRVATNAFDAAGGFVFTNSIDPAAPQNFYLLQLR